MDKQIVISNEAPAPIGPYSQAVKAGGFLFISGQIAIDQSTGTINNTTIEEETRQVMKNLLSILKSSGLDFSHIVKTTIFLSDMSHFNMVNDVYSSYFSDKFPARETVAVKGLPRNVNVEISMIASS